MKTKVVLMPGCEVLKAVAEQEQAKQKRDEEEFEEYKKAGDKERAEKGIVYEKPYASLRRYDEEDYDE